MNISANDFYGSAAHLTTLCSLFRNGADIIMYHPFCHLNPIVSLSDDGSYAYPGSTMGQAISVAYF